MAKRDNHYEAAFEAYLRRLRAPYVAVDETRRTLSGERSLKNLDFIVSPPGGEGSWLVDVKGRRFPSGRQKRYWKNWSTRDELVSLASWEELFGRSFTSALVFAYNIVGELAPLPAAKLFEFRGGLYAFLAVRLDHYTSWAHQISPKWDTVAMPAREFRALAVPADELLFGTTPRRGSQPAEAVA
jgi:hypothetical protein